MYNKSIFHEILYYDDVASIVDNFLHTNSKK